MEGLLTLWETLEKTLENDRLMVEHDIYWRKFCRGKSMGLSRTSRRAQGATSATLGATGAMQGSTGTTLGVTGTSQGSTGVRQGFLGAKTVWGAIGSEMIHMTVMRKKSIGGNWKFQFLTVKMHMVR